MKTSNFFAMLSRMKYINRWSLMRNTHSENLSEHSLEVSVTAHALALLSNERFNTDYNAERAAVLGLYHDAPEILTGDLPTPVKYHSDKVRAAYSTVEKNACDTFLSMLPSDLVRHYEPLFTHAVCDKELWRLVKAADKLCALTKCIDERKAGNTEFDTAAASTLAALEKLDMPVVRCFLEEFIPGFELTLDELKNEK